MHIGSLKACSLQKIVTMSLLTVTAVLALQGQAFAGQNQKTKVYKEQSPNGVTAVVVQNGEVQGLSSQGKRVYSQEQDDRQAQTNESGQDQSWTDKAKNTGMGLAKSACGNELVKTTVGVVAGVFTFGMGTVATEKACNVVQKQEDPKVMKVSGQKSNKKTVSDAPKQEEEKGFFSSVGDGLSKIKEKIVTKPGSDNEAEMEQTPVEQTPKEPEQTKRKTYTKKM